MTPSLYLASTSPRRRELLQQLGLEFFLLKIAVDETRREGETPEQYVARLAEEKALAGLSQVEAGAVVIAADTTVALGDDELGKPASEASGGKLVEGAFTAEVLLGMAKDRGVDMPITQAVVSVLGGELSVQDAVTMLLTRPFKAEVR